MSVVANDNVPEVLSGILVIAIGTISYLYKTTKKELKDNIKDKDAVISEIVSAKDLQIKELNDQIIKIIEEHNSVLTLINESRSKDIKDVTKAFTEINVLMNQIKPILDEKTRRV